MSITTRVTEEIKEATIKVQGEFNFDLVMDLRDAYIEPDLKSYSITVDLTDCTYMDSAALGAMLIMKSHLGKPDGEIVIKVADPYVRKVLEAAHFEIKFTFS
ncbi:MAG: STAS domain-containing protein [Immundisolibacteraceae bacterium]|nr:STAS domain-containing protein [Immundisolibacteraceae bacterium]